MGSVRVSFVVPARDEAGYVGRALASVARQDWPLEEVEAVVVDNGSSDGTEQAVREFAALHPELQLQVLREPRRGRARAKNAGARAASGRWLIFLDADSVASPNLARAVLARAEAGWPAGSIRVVADSQDPLDRGFFALLEFGKQLFSIRAQMFYCRADLFAQLGGFQEDLQIAEDLEFLRRLEAAGLPTCHVTEAYIATSPRRLRALPLRLGMLYTFCRWALAHVGVGRRWPY
ncbi:Poly-beta-1,6-N-acetyl-D-glucosamine synthase [bacterium HR32]|jgi:glycosyltransferase involved in cell wall biosynthesis|nr:Poly-beta-1,6-N-acetyl-D-glucosamine synthase [bacterium HR32]